MSHLPVFTIIWPWEKSPCRARSHTPDWPCIVPVTLSFMYKQTSDTFRIKRSKLMHLSFLMHPLRTTTVNTQWWWMDRKIFLLLESMWKIILEGKLWSYLMVERASLTVSNSFLIWPRSFRAFSEASLLLASVFSWRFRVLSSSWLV